MLTLASGGSGAAGHADPPPAAAQHPGLQRRVLHGAHVGAGGPLLLPGGPRSGEWPLFLALSSPPVVIATTGGVRLVDADP